MLNTEMVKWLDDSTSNKRTNVFGELPDTLNFEVAFEPTLVPHKKYVLNATTGEYLDTVGHTFNCASHPEYVHGVWDVMMEELHPADLEGVTVDFKAARHGAWMLMNVVFPNVKVHVETGKHSTEIAQRVIGLHGIDGSCSNQVYYGGIDFFCTNGMISGEYDVVRRKNSSGFNMATFIEELRKAEQDFYEHGRKLQTWASTHVGSDAVKEMLLEVLQSQRKADKMFSLFMDESVTRGFNLFSLYSAFTNYASHATEENGFELRTTRNDTGAQTMFKRENDVSKWISTPQVQALKLAA